MAFIQLPEIPSGSLDVLKSGLGQLGGLNGLVSQGAKSVSDGMAGISSTNPALGRTLSSFLGGAGSASSSIQGVLADPNFKAALADIPKELGSQQSQQALTEASSSLGGLLGQLSDVHSAGPGLLKQGQDLSATLAPIIQGQADTLLKQIDVNLPTTSIADQLNELIAKGTDSLSTLKGYGADTTGKVSEVTSSVQVLATDAVKKLLPDLTSQASFLLQQVMANSSNMKNAIQQLSSIVETSQVSTVVNNYITGVQGLPQSLSAYMTDPLTAPCPSAEDIVVDSSDLEDICKKLADSSSGLAIGTLKEQLYDVAAIARQQAPLLETCSSRYASALGRVAELAVEGMENSIENFSTSISRDPDAFLV